MKRRKQDDTPEGGWQGPPRTYWSEQDSLKPLAIAVGVDRKGRWIWKKVKQTKEDRKKRKIWEKALAKAERRGDWSFPNPFKAHRKKMRKKRDDS